MAGNIRRIDSFQGFRKNLTLSPYPVIVTDIFLLYCTVKLVHVGHIFSKHSQTTN